MEPGPPDGPTVGEPPAKEGEARGDRALLGGFLVYVLLLALAVFGQLTNSRAILDLFDLGRYFTR